VTDSIAMQVDVAAAGAVVTTAFRWTTVPRASYAPSYAAELSYAVATKP
jgi:hypothetical protein